LAASPSPSAKASPTPTKKAKTKVKTQPPPKNTPVAPPPPPPPAPGCTPSHFGTDAPKADVRKALDATSTRPYYQSKPQLVIPAKLLYAVAWQESGWQSTIKACDGGLGTMQVMPGTVDFLNKYVFGEHLDPMTLSGNTQLGGQYLAYLTKFFGDQLVPQTYDLLADDTTLLNAVISAYNVGPGNVKLAQGWDGIPNKQYVNNVRALMDNCPCSAF
jgi:soluble lytic murein transglycosylase-like protein